MGDDPYSRVDYRRMVAWPGRLRRESDLLLRLLDETPERSVVDLGCGTGEHSRFLGQLGFRVLGVDSSESMLARATEGEVPANVQFVQGDLRDLESLTKASFGAAICLGNTLVHLTEEADLLGFLEGVHDRILPGGIFFFQILNYDRIFQKGIRYLPLNFRAGDEGEMVFLRLMKLMEDGTVLFCPSTLAFHPSQEEALQVVRSKVVRLRGWKKAGLLTLLDQAGWHVQSVFGDMEGGPYSAADSTDLVVVAKKG